jgi:acyl dehydratase
MTTTEKTTLPPYTLATAQECVGRDLGASEWVLVDQDRIDRFAECTGDRQWIHVDVERARRESPFGGPIAHGYLTLSLVAAMVMELGIIPPDAAPASTMAWTKSASSLRSKPGRAFGPGQA